MILFFFFWRENNFLIGESLNLVFGFFLLLLLNWRIIALQCCVGVSAVEQHKSAIIIHTHTHTHTHIHIPSSCTSLLAPIPAL